MATGAEWWRVVASGRREWRVVGESGEWRSVTGKLEAEHHREANGGAGREKGHWGGQEADTRSKREQKLVQSISSMQGASNGRLALLIYNSGGGGGLGGLVLFFWVDSVNPM